MPGDNVAGGILQQLLNFLVAN